ncbi:MAG: hypothetical protein M1823_005830 [Watsoniomyces obsoletus]|nr:MAG: hypothetical protein M1823_005830 [Watsoniomyces obsoletus]
MPGMRDSLELASLASSAGADSTRTSLSSSPSGVSSSRKLSLDDDGDDNGQSSRRPLHNRTYSVSTAFDFLATPYPLSPTSLEGYAPVGAPSSANLGANGVNGAGGSLERQKSLTYTNGLSLLVGLVVGSGIFSSPSQVNSHVGSPGASLIIWGVAGMLVWTGAASYAELGSAIPLNGGPQVYLTKIFGEFAGFLFTWCAVWVLKPGSAAIIAIIFGEYLVRAVVGADALHANVWIDKGVALAGIWLVTLINSISTRLATRTGDMFMFFKFVALLGVTVTGIVVAITGFSWNGDANKEWKTKGWFENTKMDVSQWAVALYAGLWAFDGWDNVNYVVGEFRNPNRDLPRVIHTSMPLVTLFYLLANIAYFFVLPFDTISKSNTVAVQFGHKVFGAVGSAVLAIVVSFSCFGALNATTFTAGRLIYSAGKEGHLPSFFGRLGLGSSSSTSFFRRTSRSRSSSRSSQRHFLSKFLLDEAGIGFTPIHALILNASLTSLYILLGDFGQLITFYGVAGYIFYFLTILGLIILRVKEPGLERPYKTWITTPIIFCCVSLFLVSRAVFAQPIQTGLVGVFMAVGTAVYVWKKQWRRWKGGAAGGGSSSRKKRMQVPRIVMSHAEDDEEEGGEHELGRPGREKKMEESRWKFWRRWR